MRGTISRFCGGFIRIAALATTVALASMSARAMVITGNISSNMTIRGDFEMEVLGSTTVTISGIIDGSGRIKKLGTGTLRLSNANNSFANGVLIERGRVYADNVKALGPGKVTIGGDPTASLQQLWLVAAGTYNNDFEIASEQYSATEPAIYVYPTGTTTLNGRITSSCKKVMIRVGQSTSSRGNVVFNGSVELGEDTWLTLMTWGNATFNSSLVCKDLIGGTASGQTGSVIFGADSQPSIGRATALFTSNCQLQDEAKSLGRWYWTNCWTSAYQKFTMNGHDQSTPSISFHESPEFVQRFFNGSCNPETDGPSITSTAPATLTVTGDVHIAEGYTVGTLTNQVAYVHLMGDVSLRLDAWTNAYVQTLRLLPSTTTGGLDVERGTLRIEAPVTFRNLTSIRVGGDGVLDVALTNCPGAFTDISGADARYPSDQYVERMFASVTNLEVYGKFRMNDIYEADPLPSVSQLALGSGARLETPNGYVLRVGRFLINGVEQAPGVYSPGQMVNGGIVIVEGGTTIGCNWMGTNANESVQYGYNWEGYGQWPPDLTTGLLTPYFASKGERIVFDMPVTFKGMRLKAPTNKGTKLQKEKGVGGRGAKIGLLGGGIVTTDGTSTSASARRTHVVEPPIVVHTDQSWDLQTASTVLLEGGFTDGGTRGVRVYKTGRGTLGLLGTNVLSAGSALVVPAPSSNQGTLGVTGTVHLAGAIIISNGNFTVNGRIAGSKGGINRANPVHGGDGTLTFRQYSSAYLFRLNSAELDVPVWLVPSASGRLFTLLAGTTNIVRGPVTAEASSISTITQITTSGARIEFEDRVVINCVCRTQNQGAVVFRNKRVESNGGNLFYVYSPTAGVTEFDCVGNAFRNPDTGGLTFDYNQGKAVFDVSLAVTNGTLRFNDMNERNVYASLCDLGSTSQRVDRLVGMCPNGAVNPAVIYGDGAWLEIAGNGMSSTNGAAISNNVNIAKTGSADLLFYGRDFESTGDIFIGNGRMEFATNASWRCGSRISVVGPGCLRLDASERFSNRVRLQLDNLWDYFGELEDVWRLELPEGVTQSVASVTMDGVPVHGGFLGNTNYNPSVTWHDDRIEGAGVIKVANKASVIRFR